MRSFRVYPFPALRFLFLGLLLGTAAAANPPAGSVWPHEKSDVPSDDRIVWGRLENGLRYVIRRNALPAGRASLVLSVRTGSVHEKEDQLGYAHLVEHMLFNGTRRFPGSTLVAQMQREGISFGADLNAFTTYTSTFYNLDLPNDTPERIGWGLDIMRDFADGGIFDKAKLKQELKVIESERRDRESTQSHVADRVQAFLLPDSLLPRRPPLGSAKILARATVERLHQFYRTWYRPDRMTLIAVGDFEPPLLEAMVRARFAPMQPTGGAPPEPDLQGHPGTGQTTAQYFAAATEKAISVFLCNVRPHPPGDDTIAERRAGIASQAGAWILHDRINEIIRAAPLDYGRSQVIRQDYLKLASFGQIQLECQPQLWRRTLRLAEQELRRALLHGFSATEVQTQIARLTSLYQESINTEPSWPSDWIAQQIRGFLDQEHVYCSARQSWELARPAVEQLTPEAVAAQFRQDWSSGSRRIALIGGPEFKLDPPAMLEAYQQSVKGNLLAHERAAAPSFDYGSFGVAGLIRHRGYSAPIETHSVEFMNGVRLNVKRTDYETGRIYLRLRLGHGLAQEPSYWPGLGLLAGNSFAFGGVVRHTPTELDRILAGRTLSIQFSVAEDAFYFDGHADPAALELLFQLCTAYLTDPAYRLSGFETAASMLRSQYQQAEHDPLLYARAYAPFLVAGGDSRYGLPPATKALSRTLPQIQEWLQPVLQQGAIEIGLAGDLEPESVITAAARTFGTLPARRSASLPDTARRPVFPAQGFTQIWKIDSPEAKAAVHVYWPGTDDNNYHVQRRLSVLADTLNDRLRLKLREEMGATYAPQVESWGSRVYPDYGYLMAETVTSPGQAEKVARLIRQIARDMAAKGITADEFERARQPILAMLKQHLRNNSYWTWYVLTYLQQSPAVVQMPLNRSDEYLTMTLAEINDLARSHLGSDRVCTLIVVPGK